MTRPVWAVLPASGIGSRMGADRPKQYLPLDDRSIIEHSLERLLTHPRIDGVVVALAARDPWWAQVRHAQDKPLLRCQGGRERAHSVRSALETLERHLQRDALVLVHDAVRPFVLHRDLDRLIDQASIDDHGALLATPLADTLKRASSLDTASDTDTLERVEQTVPRERLWQALTPQAFRLSLLRDALDDALSRDLPITDDASAMELAGYRPRLVAGDRRNIKLTHPEDLLLAEWIRQSIEAGDKS